MGLSNGRLNAINEIPLDDYIACVLKAEIGSAPYEALKAQAVVARSEAIHKLKLGRHAGDGYDLCSSEHCMAYQGTAGITAEMRQAAYDTKGEVLVAEGGILDAVFHTMCGGITAGAEDVWDSPPVAGLEPVWDGLARNDAPSFRSEEEMESFLSHPPAACFCDPSNALFPAYARKYYRWTKSFTATDLQRLFGTNVQDVKVVERRPSGRVRRVAVLTATGVKIIEKELPIRKQFDLPSGLFVVRVATKSGVVESVEFFGAGSGHGVGLCQMGAWSMAEKGFHYDAILRHYYPRAQLARLYR
ncbi:MAG: SpoIID/LytB domain-containing protein [Candidatus Sumerlaeaceae bacterium]|nr:SpoIID/LytB domain-containing protein [Candidatus Sumerlaeaceae bacterium]